MKNVLYRNKRNNRKGFTLAEMLGAVAILIILFALAVPAVFAIQRNLRQKELDSKAETIYTAVQDKLTEMYTSGKSSQYDPKNNTDIKSIGSVLPSDYVRKNDDEQPQSIYYFTSDSEFGKKLVSDNVLSDDLKNGHWVIEFIPYAVKTKEDEQNHVADKLTHAAVYSVYYSEEYDIAKTDVTPSKYAYSSANGTITENFREKYRYRDDRKDKDQGDARVGYYGGSNAGSGSNTADFELLTLKINSSSEINTAEVKIKNPYSVMEGMKYTFTLSDDYDNSYTMLFDGTNFTTADGKQTIPDPLRKHIQFQKVGSVYSFVFTLDDLSSDATRFISLYGSKSGHGKGRELVSGSNIRLTVTAESTKDKRLKSVNDYTLGNSIFDYSQKATGTKKTFTISNGRHLQNLDNESGCEEESKKSGTAIANISKDISFDENSDFYKAYKDKYFNDFVNIAKVGSNESIKVPNFKSIANHAINQLSSTENNTCTISGLSTSGEGLFKSVDANNGVRGKLTLSGFNLTGEHVYGNKTAGGLVGTVGNADLTISKVQIYLDKTKGDIPDTITSDTNAEAVRWIYADVTGGFVGVNNGTVTITDSSVSTVLGKSIDMDNSLTGGMVGQNNGTVKVSKSYTDNYQYGKTVAGMIGKNEGTATISTSYAAGFNGVVNKEGAISAGFVTGKKAKIENSYTVIAAYPIASDGGLYLTSEMDAVNFIYYRTGENVDLNKVVYYLRDNKNVDNNDSAAAIGKVSDMQLSGFSLTTKKAVSPYQLLGKSLSNYEYPKLDLNHYGDWTADYVPGALVYYEKYKNVDENNNTTYTFGFEGANLDVSLINDQDVVGDGYGVIYKADTTEEKPAAVDVTVNGSTQTIILNSAAPYKATVSGVTYDIYPLSTETDNPEKAVSGYYERVKITGKDKNTSEVSVRYYDFNPHFARTVREVTDEKAETGSLPSSISIRSPRHLYDLSLFYGNTGGFITEKGYKSILGQVTYKQERNMVYSNYDWNAFYKAGSAVITKQAPIGDTETNAFDSNYDGGCYRIGDVGFYTKKGYYVGMFGYVKGNISNVFLLTQYDSDDSKDSFRVEREDKVQRNETLYAGVLAGKNEGTVTNCSVAGYYLSQVADSIDGTIYGYENSTLYIGGLVGWNEGKISNSSADNPKLSLYMFKANCYAGGFVGYNSGDATISNCYALANITSDATDGKTVIGGFAGYNAAGISDSYCVTALTAQGTGTQAYAFGSKEGNGIESRDYYLSQGSYRFVNELHSYGRGELDSGEGTEADSTGHAATFEQLAAQRANGTAVYSDFFNETKKLDGSSTDYPFRAVVRDRNGQYIHHGEWVVKPALGAYGVFYWEHETSGENNGYKFTYAGLVDDTFYSSSTLCDAHDDGGVITEYGYGYYKTKDDSVSIDATANNMQMQLGELNTTVQTELQNQVPGIEFYPYTTGTGDNSLKLVKGYDGQNADLTITVAKNNESRTVSYQISPFFANALALNKNSVTGVIKIDNSEVSSRYILDGTKNEPGKDDNAYEIRSAQQLQFINWNSQDGKVDSLVSSTNYQNFNYLLYATVTGQGLQTLDQETNKDTGVISDGAGHRENASLVFKQSHDLNAKEVKNYVPIACPTTTSSDRSYSAVLYSWFGSAFDGQSYKIQELSINTKGYAVGLFGVTVGADIKNVIMYSENNAVIQRATSGPDDYKGAYSIGGLIGVAYDYNLKPVGRTISNCAIAGYKIQDNSKNRLTLGEANIGGLIGVSNIQVESCSAVVDIEVNATHPLSNKDEDGITTAAYGNFIRVGGLCGAVKGVVKDCYTGGNISVDKKLLQETYSSGSSFSYKGTGHVNYENTESASVQGSSHVFISGIAGSAFTMNYKNFSNTSSSEDGSPYVENCYTYVKFPTIEGTIRSVSMITSMADRHSATQKIATIKNCYYLDDSAKLDYNLPHYYFNGKSTFSAYNQRNSTYLETYMIRGDVRWLQLILNGRTSSSKVSIDVLSAKSFTELSDDSMIGSLNKGNTVWGQVTTTDKNGMPVNGKYSFNAGNSSLNGKNYPFPTVVKQGTSINVHYGEWPANGPTFEHGEGNIDLITDLQANGFAEKKFKINKVNDSLKNAINNGKVDFEFSDPEYVDKYAVSIVNDSGKDMTAAVTIRANKTGSTKVTMSWPNENGGKDKAEFTLTVTCNFTVSADQRSLVLGNNESAEVTLSANDSASKPVNTTGNNFEWNVTISRNHMDSADDAAASIDKARSKLNITGYGLDATITVKGVYSYQGQKYESVVRISVRKQNFVGISDNSNFYEVTMKDGDTAPSAMQQVTYGDDSSPSYTGSSYYLYQFKDSDLIDNNVSLTLWSSNVEVAGATVSLGEKVSSGEYDYYPINIDTNGVDPSADLSNAEIHAVISKGTLTYQLSVGGVSVQTPYRITFADGTTEIADAVSLSNLNTDSVPITVKDTASLNRDGCFLAGWYADGKVKVLEADGTVVSGTVDGYVSDGKLALSSHAVTLHPLWVSYTAVQTDSVTDDGLYLPIGTEGSGTAQSYFTYEKDSSSHKILNVVSINNDSLTIAADISDYCYSGSEWNNLAAKPEGTLYQITRQEIYND